MTNWVLLTETFYLIKWRKELERNSYLHFKWLCKWKISTTYFQYVLVKIGNVRDLEKTFGKFPH